MYALRSRGMGTYISWPICGYPNQQIQVPNPGLSGFRKGLGCGCGCGGSCFKGLGYFDTGWDISGWGWMEWGTILGIAYMLMSTVQTTKRGVQKARKRVRRFRQS